MELASIISSFFSVFLAIFAIYLSINFYNQSKNVEKEVAKSLESIKSQTDTLQKLSGRWMDKLIKNVTETNQYDDMTIFTIFSAIKDLPTNIVQQLNTPRTSELTEEVVNEIVSCYVLLYYYIGMCNYWAQQALPTLSSHEDNPEYSSFVSSIIDTTYSDFNHIEQLLSNIDDERVQKCSSAHLIDDAVNKWAPRVKNTTEVYQDRGE